MIKNITLSAEENIIEKAREKASKQNKSLNSIFRNWLKNFTEQDDALINYDKLMEKMKYAKAGKKFNRDELNER